MEVGNTAAQAVEQVKETVSWAQRLRPVRVLQRYGDRDGALLAAGLSYQSVFALFAAIWVGFSVAGIWIRSDKVLYDRLIGIINQSIPGLIGPNGVISETMLDSANLTLRITAIVALLGLVWTAVGWLSSTRTAIRTMFLLGNDERNFFVQRVVDAGLALLFGVGLIVASLVSLLSQQLVEQIYGWVGISQHSPVAEFGVQAVSFVVVFLLNLATLGAMYRVLSRIYIPFRHLVTGAGLGAVSLSILSILSGLLLGGASKNPFLATFAVFVGLLIWFNFVCQVILICAAWIAVGMEDRGIAPRKVTPEEALLEQARAEFRERLDRATAAVRRASADYDAAKGWRDRRRARKQLLADMHELQLIRASDPDTEGR